MLNQGDIACYALGMELSKTNEATPKWLDFCSYVRKNPADLK